MHDSKTLSRTFETYLPYIGKQKVNGKIKAPFIDASELSGCLPNYSDFKKRKYQSEEDCASVLLGINKTNIPAKCCRDIIFDYNIDAPVWNLNDDSHKIEVILREGLPSLKWEAPSENLCAGPPDDIWLERDRRSRVEVVHAFHVFKIMLNLRQTMRLGVKMARIKTDKDPEQHISPIRYKKGSLFFRDIYYNALSFLKWMKKNKYPIPHELSFVKNQSGDFIYIEDFIIKIGDECSMLYKETTKIMSKFEDVTREKACEKMVSVYSNNKQMFPNIIQDCIKEALPYFGSGQEPRDVKGNLILSVVKRQITSVIISKELPTNGQALWGLYRKLKN